MGSTELVVFDCDGVLVDSERISAEVSAEILSENGWAITPDEVLRRFTGCSDAYWRAQVSARLGLAVDEDWDARYSSRYEAAFDARLRAVPGVVEVLRGLDLPFCVASNGSTQKVRRNLARVGLLHLFDSAVFSACDVAEGKPAPDLFLLAARSHGVEPDRCVVVEDSVPGVTAARAAGMRCLAYAADHADPAALAGPTTTVFTRMHELPALLRAG